MVVQTDASCHFAEYLIVPSTHYQKSYLTDGFDTEIYPFLVPFNQDIGGHGDFPTTYLKTYWFYDIFDVFKK